MQTLSDLAGTTPFTVTFHAFDEARNLEETPQAFTYDILGSSPEVTVVNMLEPEISSNITLTSASVSWSAPAGLEFSIHAVSCEGPTLESGGTTDVSGVNTT